MKQSLTLFLCMVSACLFSQTIFVNQNAVGLNNGSTWANAYTSLDLALLNSVSGQSLWVVGGIYKPSNPAPNNTFLLAAGINLYGGFSGTETSLVQRNITDNPTILSGDILGDDISGNFILNRSDNAQHVLAVFVLTQNLRSTVDGFSVRNGHTLVADPNTDLTRRGGGIIANAKATIQNCTFSGNFGESGAAFAAIDALSDGTIIQNCVFEGNQATEDAICFLRGTPTGLIKNCIFRNNNTRRGALYPSNSSAMVIDSCLFESNKALGPAMDKYYGAGMFTWQSTFTLSNSIFRKNKADNGAGMYIDGRDGGDLATINNCLFEQDTAIDFGGAGIYSWQATMDINNCTFRNNLAPNATGMYCDGREFDSSYDIDGCTFESNVATSYGCTAIWNASTNFTISNSLFLFNVAPSSGAALYNGGNTTFLVKNCTFEGNETNYAGANANYGLGCIGTYESCIFKYNRALQGGGAVSNGFQADVKYKNCDFLGNIATFGGAIFTQNDSTRVTVEGCFFKENITSGAAGCILVNAQIAASISTSTFLQNEGDFGGAISATGDSAITIDRCYFLENISFTQGAAINFNHVKSVITNSLFAKNVNTGTGAGGAISNNASDDELSTVKTINCTFADNVAAIGAGIAQWEGSLGTSQLTTLNCLFQNPDGENYSIEAGAPEVFSLNGNQSSDQTLELYLMENKDLHSTSNTFQDADNNDYAHTLASPASDGGVSAGAPSIDIIGQSRAGIPDVGYREVAVSGTQNPDFHLLKLLCSPNPANDFTVISLQNERIGFVQVSVWNQLGQQIAQHNAEKTANEFSYSLNVNVLPAGTYKVQVRIGAMVHEGAFVKY